MNTEAPADVDSQLMLAFSRGDRGCFDKLFSKYKKPVINFAHRFTGRREVAEELAQEIFVKCYMAAPDYQVRARFSTWLFRIARNHCLNEVRRQDYRYHTEPLDGPEPAGGAASPEQLAQAYALREALLQTMARLPESQRTALLLSRQQGMPYDQIAETMETSVSAVKSLLNRAKSTLTRQLAGYLENRHEV